jgi:tetratricopeptide (TPR) repeat protein
VYSSIGLPHLALKCHEECLLLRRGFLSPSHPDVLLSEAELACCWFENEKPEDGIRLLEKVFIEAKRVLPPSHSYLGTFMNQLGTIYGKSGRYQESLQLLEEHLAYCNLVLQPGNYEFIKLHLNLGITLFALGRRKQAALSLAECVRVANLNGLGEDDSSVQAARRMMRMIR